jgi:hypothetical protein
VELYRTIHADALVEDELPNAESAGGEVVKKYRLYELNL